MHAQTNAQASQCGCEVVQQLTTGSTFANCQIYKLHGCSVSVQSALGSLKHTEANAGQNMSKRHAHYNQQHSDICLNFLTMPETLLDHRKLSILSLA